MRLLHSLIITNLVLMTTVISALEPKEDSLNARKKLLQHDIKEIVFCTRGYNNGDGHWYANFGYYFDNINRKVYAEGGGLHKYNIETKEVTTLIDAKQGTVRDPQVHYNGKKIIFSYRKDGSGVFHLYEINTNGSGLKQLTDGIYDDIEPSYFPGGSIVFISGRGKRWVNCWIVQVGTLFKCDADGKNIRELSANIEHDNTPWPLPDGRILYTRWEYVDRSQVTFHHLWTANPDGTNQQIYFGNQPTIPKCLLIDAKPLSQKSDKVLALLSPGHGHREHEGKIVIINNSKGVDNKEGIEYVTKFYVKDPFPITENFYLAAGSNSENTIIAVNRQGQREIIYQAPKNQKLGVHEPRPIVKRVCETIVPSRVDLSNPNGTLILMDVYEGRNMKGIKRGAIKKLLITETLPKPINYSGSMEPLSWGGTFTLMRILGTVPVEKDGSANFNVPANRSIVLMALDENGKAVKKMHSFLTVMPGEVLSCIGCHEERNQAPTHNRFPLATRRPPSSINKLKNIPEVFNFPTDIQPIFDKYCVSCHNDKKKSGGVNMTGDLGPLYTQSYYYLSALRQFGDARNRACGNFAPYKMYDAIAPLMTKISKKHHNVQLTNHEQQMIRLWLQVGAPYLGSYAGLGTGMIGGDYFDHLIEREDLRLESVQKAQVVIEKNCSECHYTKIQKPRKKLTWRHNFIKKYCLDQQLKNYWHLSEMNGYPKLSNDRRVLRKLPSSPSDQTDMRPEKINYDRWRIPFTQHAVYNLSYPEKSTILTAPLAESAGGNAVCKRLDGNHKVTNQKHIVFKSTDDPNYQIILKAIKDVANMLEKRKRWYMKGFKPHDAYIREMIRYGVLPDDYDVNNTTLTPFQIDQLYWESLHYKPNRKY
ncbi:hypothetical protein AAEX28_02185 [Lentisphaerota bacterium WC36G]|nr:hypothetical protein LJT99_05070 [Lentisphaerae bacterium WC36]